MAKRRIAIPPGGFRRIAVLRLSSLGDVILTLPVVQALHAAYPEGRIEYWCKEEYADVLRHDPAIGHLRVLERDARRLEDLVSMSAELEETDLIVDLHRNLRTRVLTYRQKAPVLTAPAFRLRRAALVHARALKPKVPPTARERFAMALRPLGLTASEAPRVALDPAGEGWAQAWISEWMPDRPPLALLPGARHFTKRWPEDHWTALFDALVAARRPIVVCSTAAERAGLPALAARVAGQPLARWCVEPLARVAAVLARCSGAVCSDSGVMHLAAAVGLRVVALFGSTAPELGFAPAGEGHVVLCRHEPCQPCTLHGRPSCPRGHFRCMREITAEQVMEAVGRAAVEPRSRRFVYCEASSLTSETMSDSQDKKAFVEDLTDQGDDFARWYNEVVRKAQLADYAPVKGCMVIRPYGFALWENMRDLLDARIKATGHQNAYFPLLIPESLLQKEAEHVEGFAPQVAWVTHGGNAELEERLAIRPTSEAIIGTMYARWIESYRDLPVLLNQWANVMRWEKVTRLFLRTTEFLWQEGHTAHATAAECREEVLRMLQVYRDFAEQDLAMPVHAGQKSASEKFAGAEETFSIEALMKDGRALQAGTSHDLGQHFAKVFDITFQDEQGQRQYVHQTSWGVSTRLVGAVIMTHGDDQGLKLPPRVAPVQAVVIPIGRKPEEKSAVAEHVAKIREILQGRVRVLVDDREQYTPGWKYNEHELRGVPVRLEVGPKDVAGGSVMAVRRDTRAKEAVPLANLAERLPALLGEIQRDLYAAAVRFREENTRRVASVEELEAHFTERRGFVALPWQDDDALEARIKERSGATLRCLPLDVIALGGSPGERLALFAKAY